MCSKQKILSYPRLQTAIGLLLPTPSDTFPRAFQNASSAQSGFSAWLKEQEVGLSGMESGVWVASCFTEALGLLQGASYFGTK